MVQQKVYQHVKKRASKDLSYGERECQKVALRTMNLKETKLSWIRLWSHLCSSALAETTEKTICN